MKILRNILILVAVFGVLSVAYYFVKVYEPKTEESTPETTRIDVFKTEKANISKIEIKNPDDEYAFYKTDGGWVVPGREFIELNQSRVDSLAYSVASVSAESLVEENPSDLGAYGLSEPPAIVNLTLEDGSTKTFYIGDKTPTRTRYYFKTSDQNAVYTIYSGGGDNFYQELNAYRIMTIASFDAATVREIIIERPNSPLSVVYNPPSDDEQQQSYGMLSAWNVTSPFLRSADNSKVDEKLITPLTGFTADNIVEDNPDDFSKYGIGNTTVTIKTEDSSIVFKTGRRDGVNYVHVEGKSPIYTVAESKLSFLNVNPLDIIEKFASLVNIDRVQSIDIYTPKVQGQLSIKRDGESVFYYVNDTDASEDGFKSMYQKVIGLTVDGVMPQPAEKTDLQGKVVYNLTDGSIITLEFYPYDALNYAVYENEENLFFMKKTRLNDMSDALIRFSENPRQRVN